MYGDTFDFINGQSPINMNMDTPRQSMINNQFVTNTIPKPEVQVVKSETAYSIPIAGTKSGQKATIKIDDNIDTEKKRSSKSNKKEENLHSPMGKEAVINGNEITTRSNGEVVEDIPTINTYFETASMIKQSMDQIDTVMIDIKKELDDVRRSRTLKSKYNVMVGLAGNLSDLMNARISAIKELNNCISKSNDMDYKRQKDRKEAMMGAGGGDELAVMNLYKTMVSDPGIVLGQAGQKIPDYMIKQMQQQMNGGVTNGMANVSGIVRGTESTPINNNNMSFDPTQDQGYINYMANMPPAMNALLMEQNPDIKEVVVFDASTGAKWFQVMNTKTNQVIPNMQVTDQMFMEDTTLNIKNRTAQNINLGKVYPLVVINDNVTSKY